MNTKKYYTFATKQLKRYVKLSKKVREIPNAYFDKVNKTYLKFIDKQMEKDFDYILYGDTKNILRDMINNLTYRDFEEV